MKFRNLFLIFCSIISVLSCSSCHEDKNDIIPEPEEVKPNHTYLIYMMGDNSLSSDCMDNIYSIKKGLFSSDQDINLVIYKDNNDKNNSLPVLFQLKREVDEKTNTARIDTIIIKEFLVDHNSCDKEIFKDIVNTTFQMFDTDVKGLEIWGHGSAWYSSQYRVPTRNYGPDGNNYFEIWDLREALEGCPHLDYINFDTCLSGMAEIAYEFCDVCDFIYAPITEIMGEGFPYHTMIPILSKCQKKETVRQTLSECVEDFAKHCGYDDYTITLLETKNSKNLAEAFARLRDARPEKLEELKADAQNLEKTFQHYGRKINYSTDYTYFFYDFQDYVNYLAQDATEDINSLLKDIEKNNIVVSHEESEKFLDEIIIDHSCGLGVSVPEFFDLNKKDSERLYKVYGMTKWGKALGF